MRFAFTIQFVLTPLRVRYFKFAFKPIIRAFMALTNVSVIQQPLGQIGQTQALGVQATHKEAMFQRKRPADVVIRGFALANARAVCRVHSPVVEGAHQRHPRKSLQ